MVRPTKKETKLVIPRDYVLSFSSRGMNFGYSPFSDALSGGLRQSPEVNSGRIKAALRYNNDYQRLKEEGLAPYEKLFPLKDGMLSMDPEGFWQEFRECVKKRTGNFSYVDHSPHEAILGLTVEENGTARAEVTSAGRGEKKPYVVVYDGLILDRNGNPDLKVISCTDDGFTYDLEKGGDKITVNECKHAAAVRNEVYEAVYAPHPQKRKLNFKGSSRERIERNGMIMPWSFGNNWKLKHNRFVAKNRDLAALEQDMLIEYFMNRESTHFSINRRAYRLQEVYSPWLSRMIREGKVRRQVISGGTFGRNISRREADAHNETVEKLIGIFNSKGFRFTGRYIEMGRVAWCYEDPDTILGLVPDIEGTFYTIRKKDGKTGRIDPVGHDGQEGLSQDPFISFGWRGSHQRYCDLLMRETDFDVEFPTAIRFGKGGRAMTGINIPSIEYQKIKKGINEANRTKTDNTRNHRLRLARVSL